MSAQPHPAAARGAVFPLAAFLGTALLSASASASAPLALTVREQFMPPSGREEWLDNHTQVQWDPAETAIVVIDMWNVHWCASATTRVAEIAQPMQQWAAAARKAGVTVVWAPSDVTAFYTDTAARNNTLALPKAPLPPSRPFSVPAYPLSTATDGGCDTNCSEGSPWTRQIDTLVIEPTDFLISADVPGGTQELWNVLHRDPSRPIKHVMYAGVHENMCIMARPFALLEMRSLGWPKGDLAVVRELVDVMYTPRDLPYVSHADGLAIHTSFIEKFVAASVSMYDVLAPSYKAVARREL